MKHSRSKDLPFSLTSDADVYNHDLDSLTKAVFVCAGGQRARNDLIMSMKFVGLTV